MRQHKAVCLLCRSKLFSPRASRRLQRPAAGNLAHAATFATANAGVAVIVDDNASGNGKQKAGKDTGQTPWQIRRVAGTLSSHGPIAVLADKDIDDGKQRVEDLLAPTLASAIPSHNLELFKNAAKLDELLRQPSVSTGTCFRFFESHIYPEIVQARTHAPRVIRLELARRLLARVCEEQVVNMGSPNLPSVSRVSQILHELGLLEPRPWMKMTLRLLDHICSISTSSSGDRSIDEHERSLAKRLILIQDLLQNWKIFNLPRYKAIRSSNTSDEANSVSPEYLEPPRNARNNKIPKPHLSFAAMFPHHHPTTLQGISNAAIGTYAVLTESILQPERSLCRDAGPFVGPWARILAEQPPTLQQLKTMFEDYPNLLTYMTSRWPVVLSQLGRSEPQNNSQKSEIGNGNNLWEDSKYLDTLHRNLHRSCKAKDEAVVTQMWDRFWRLRPPRTTTRPRQLHQQARIFDLFVMAFMAVNQPKHAFLVWDCMTMVNLSPSIKTWSAMLEGCWQGRNLNGVKAVWEQLIASGIQPDSAAWTSRISALIDLGEPEAGLAALDEMSRCWKEKQAQSSEGKMDALDVEPVNAAVSGLIRLDRTSVAKSVLLWASRQGIQPNVFTFNILLKPMLKAGFSDEVREILSLMQQQNIKPDGATYTILTEAVLGDQGEFTGLQQVERVNQLLREAESAGLKLNVQNYTKIVHVLLNHGGDGVVASVNAVLEHIVARGFKPTSHIYTMLVDHHFSLSPPDVAAVNALIADAGHAADGVFWDRVALGCCAVGDIDAAMRAFDRMLSAAPGAKLPAVAVATLHDLLVTLVAAGRMKDAARVVGAAFESCRGAPDLEAGTRKLRHRFWHRAEEYGLLSEERRKMLLDDGL